jgi:SAM-dependent methyltransferase
MIRRPPRSTQPTTLFPYTTLFRSDLVVNVRYAACDDCRLIFQATYPSDDFLRRYYASSPMLRRREVSPYEADQHVRQAAFLQRHLALAGCRVGEVGAGSGGFLAHLQQAHGCTAYYDDLSDEALATLAQIPGLRRLDADVRGLDLVVLRHVIEHVADPDAFIAAQAARLADDGALFVEVPDWSYFDADCDPLIFEHLSQFSSGSLLALFARLGWTCDALEKSVCATDPASPNRVLRALFRKPRLSSARAARLRDAFHADYLPRYDGINTRIDAFVARHPGRRVALWPASHLSFSLLLETRRLHGAVVGLFDIDKKKQGRRFQGIGVHPPEALPEFAPDIVLITTMGYEDEIKDRLRQLGVRALAVSLKELLADATLLADETEPNGGAA